MRRHQPAANGRLTGPRRRPRAGCRRVVSGCIGVVCCGQSGCIHAEDGDAEFGAFCSAPPAALHSAAPSPNRCMPVSTLRCTPFSPSALAAWCCPQAVLFAPPLLDGCPGGGPPVRAAMPSGHAKPLRVGVEHHDGALHACFAQGHMPSSAKATASLSLCPAGPSSTATASPAP